MDLFWFVLCIEHVVKEISINIFYQIKLIQLFKDLAFITHRPSLALESHRSKEHSDEQTYRISQLPRSIVPLLLFHCCFHMAHPNERPHSTHFLNQLPFQQNKLLLEPRFRACISIQRLLKKLTEKGTLDLAGLC